MSKRMLSERARSQPLDPKRENTCSLWLRAFSLGIQAGLILVSAASADPCPNAQAWLEKAFEYEPLRAVKDVGPGEKAIAGTIYDGEMMLPENMADGVYLYFVDDKKRVAWSPRVIDLDLENPLVSHRSEVAAYIQKYGHPPRVMASGEVHIRSGQVKTLSNKSGTYPGGPERVQLAEDVLQRRGLKVRPNTERLDYSTRPPDPRHIAEFGDALLEVKLRRYARGPEFMNELDRVMKLMSEAYPAEYAGAVDWGGFMMSTERRFGSPPRDFSISDEDALFSMKLFEADKERYLEISRLLAIFSDRLKKAKGIAISKRAANDVSFTEEGLDEGIRILKQIIYAEGFVLR